MITLYLKESPKGLKYLGKTIKNPYEYMGSGIIWCGHIKKHKLTQDDIKTTVLFQSKNKSKFNKVSLYYSKLYDVVNSKSFANLTEEMGQGGKTISKETHPHHPAYSWKTTMIKYWENPNNRKVQSMRMKINNPMNNLESRKKLSNSLKNHIVLDEIKLKISESVKKWYITHTNPFKNKTHTPEIRNHLSKINGTPVVINDIQYNSIRHAARILDTTRYFIKKQLYGKQ